VHVSSGLLRPITLFVVFVLHTGRCFLKRHPDLCVLLADSPGPLHPRPLFGVAICWCCVGGPWQLQPVSAAAPT
jgi:hypothetical protein